MFRNKSQYILQQTNNDSYDSIFETVMLQTNSFSGKVRSFRILEITPCWLIAISVSAPSLNKCHFPPWMTNYNHWHSLDYSTTYSFHHRDATLRIGNSTSGTEMKVLCTHVKYTSRNESAVVLLTHFTMGWWGY